MHRIKIKNQNILLFSDTHGAHRQLEIPKDIQIIIHCGDICHAGDMDEILDFFDWYAHLEIPHKIFIHGNHDLPFEFEPEWSKRYIPENIIWLNDESVKINEINIAGIGAFPSENDFEINEKIDILVSHYPPYGILDNGIGSKEIGRFVSHFEPAYHVFGHNHLGYGEIKHGNTQYINASVFHILFQE